MNYPPVEQLLPHTGSAVLIDAIRQHREEAIHVTAHITDNHPFFVAGRGVPVWVGLEMMAQAVAAYSGLEGLHAGAGPREGMLLGTRRYQGRVTWFEKGQTLDIHAQAAFGQAGTLAACQCHIDSRGRRLAEATIFIAERAPEPPTDVSQTP